MSVISQNHKSWRIIEAHLYWTHTGQRDPVFPLGLNQLYLPQHFILLKHSFYPLLFGYYCLLFDSFLLSHCFCNHRQCFGYHRFSCVHLWLYFFHQWLYSNFPQYSFMIHTHYCSVLVRCYCSRWKFYSSLLR